MGDLSSDAKGNLVPTKTRDGKYTDNKGRATNKKGFLIDAKANIIDVLGNLMFEKYLLNKEGELPELFKQQEKIHDSNSELEHLM
jgi:hypothetical protein